MGLVRVPFVVASYEILDGVVAVTRVVVEPSEYEKEEHFQVPNGPYGQSGAHDCYYHLQRTGVAPEKLQPVTYIGHPLRIAR